MVVLKTTKNPEKSHPCNIEQILLTYWNYAGNISLKCEINYVMIHRHHFDYHIQTIHTWQYLKDLPGGVISVMVLTSNQKSEIWHLCYIRIKSIKN